MLCVTSLGEKSRMDDFVRNCDLALDSLHSYHAHGPEANIDKYFACFSPQGRFLGTDGKESWSVEDFRRYSEPFFNGPRAAPFVPRPGSRKFVSFPPNSPTPIVVAFDEILECEGMKGQARGNGSLVWDQDQQKWLVFLYHLSIPVPNEIAERVCAITRSARK
jgi:hypothetical protein